VVVRAGSQSSVAAHLLREVRRAGDQRGGVPTERSSRYFDATHLRDRSRYSFDVTAINAGGNGQGSAGSKAVTPVEPPR
jgi:hypothetical protein